LCKITNKTKKTDINDNHIKFEVSLHFWLVWPMVRWPPQCRWWPTTASASSSSTPRLLVFFASHPSLNTHSCNRRPFTFRLCALRSPKKPVLFQNKFIMQPRKHEKKHPQKLFMFVCSRVGLFLCLTNRVRIQCCSSPNFFYVLAWLPKWPKNRNPVPLKAP
jgi:hypothetical protein